MNDIIVLIIAFLPFLIIYVCGPHILCALRRRDDKRLLFRGTVTKEGHKKHYYCHKCGKEVDYKKATYPLFDNDCHSEYYGDHRELNKEICNSCGAMLFATDFMEKYNPIKIKVTIKTTDFELILTHDYTEYAKTLIECNNIFPSTGTKMTESNICEYFRPGTFSSKDIDSLNGEHFLFGFVETIAQEPKYANLLSDFDEITFVVERIYE